MRHVTTTIHNAKKEIAQSPDVLYTVLSQLITQQQEEEEKPSHEVNEKEVGTKPPEMQLIEVPQLATKYYPKLIVYIL